MFEDQIANLTNVLKAANDSPELFTEVAKTYANMRDALIAEDFAYDDAIQILIHQGAMKTSG